MNLLKELEIREPGDLYNYFRMDITCFESLLDMVRPTIEENRILGYLATGRTYADMKFTCAISPQLPETCREMWKALKVDFLKLPSTSNEWIQVAQSFADIWDFHHCLGAMDGKHIAIKHPSNSGAYYYNYKSYYSVVLFAIVNANYEFMYVHTNGRVSDG